MANNRPIANEEQPLLGNLAVNFYPQDNQVDVNVEFAERDNVDRAARRAHNPNTLWSILVLVLSVIQLVLCLLAILLPHVVVGEMTIGDAQSFMNFQPKSEVVNASHIVQANIGVFRSFYNETLAHDYREGMGGIFGFSMLAAISSVETIFYSIRILSKSYVPAWIEIILYALSASNASSGSSGAVAFILSMHTIGDLEGGTIGICVMFHALVFLLSWLINGFKRKINES